ncbi:MAG TPA: hypothetical protein VL361_25640 [Candidatus Limnocylindrales bacterium]|nr:hypothetical protein [Candidatus Limnocylindrales bacterium]
MKTSRLPVNFALMLLSYTAFAQGQLYFSNFGAGFATPVYDTDGTTKLAGAAFAADLYFGPPGTTDSMQLIPLGQPANFAAAGYFIGGTRTLPFPAGTTITTQVRVWAWADDNSWEAAVSASGRTVESFMLPVTLTSPPTTPATLIGLRFGAQLQFIPTSSPPTLVIHSGGADTLSFSWPSGFWAGEYRLQRNPDFNPTNWTTLPDRPVPIGQTNDIHCRILLPRPEGVMFYRLAR